jgi:D-arabinose 1-dehydrogenase-like Zn-dependent alcohol dehydrogenase
MGLLRETNDGTSIGPIPLPRRRGRTRMRIRTTRMRGNPRLMRTMAGIANGGPEVLQRVDVDIPSPGPDEVLVRLGCAGINFMDIHTRQGKYKSSRTYPVRLPCTLGMEGAGEIAGLGSNVHALEVGDRVAT